MALTHTRVSEMATSIKKACDNVKSSYQELLEVLATNSDLAIDWAGDPKPAYINEDADGNLDGFLFTRSQISNVINSLDQVKKLLENTSASQGDHLGNVNHISDVQSPNN